MNPSYGIIMWIIVGAFAGWIASKIMGTDAQQGSLANIVVGVVGALIGGFLANQLGDFRGNNGIFASTAIALAGACLVLFAMKAIRGRRTA